MLSQERQEILNKIKEYERLGLFDKDVENDPETIPLTLNKVDYLNKKLSSKISTKIANKLAINYFENLIKNEVFTIKKVEGIENYLSVNGGAFITANHFSPFDNYAIYRAIRPYFKKNQQLYKVIREGNFTNFKGLYGYLFKHCNTLPLASSLSVMKEFFSAVSTLICRGEKILIYPEQAMWWNYKKPRPFKSGAFNMASKNNAPIIPCFITMNDTSKVLEDGSFAQEYTLHFLKPIYPDKNKSIKENAENLKQKNYEAFKEVYEQVYGKKLIYGE